MMPTQKEKSRRISPLYSRYLTAQERRALRAAPVADVESEINLLRVLAARLLQFQQSAPTDLDTRRQTLGASLFLSVQLAKLVRVHNHKPHPELQKPQINTIITYRPVPRSDSGLAPLPDGDEDE